MHGCMVAIGSPPISLISVIENILALWRTNWHLRMFKLMQFTWFNLLFNIIIKWLFLMEHTSANNKLFRPWDCDSNQSIQTDHTKLQPITSLCDINCLPPNVSSSPSSSSLNSFDFYLPFILKQQTIPDCHQYSLCATNCEAYDLMEFTFQNFATSLTHYFPISNASNSPNNNKSITCTPAKTSQSSREWNNKLKKHRPKRFNCPYCQVAFSNNGQLKGHVRTHTGKGCK